MSKVTSGCAIADGASNAATISTPASDDDIIPVITGVTLIDADAKAIARLLRNKSWAQRAQYFNNIICKSIERQARMLDYAQSEDDGVDFLEWSQAEMMRRIGEVLDLWGETEPADADAAVLFHLSLNPRHRRAAQSWTQGDEHVASRTWRFFDTYVQEHWEALAVFFRFSIISNPCAAAAWRAGPVECSDEWFDLPIKGGTA